MQRWRSRHGLQLRKFPAQERLSVEQMQRKVHHRVDGNEHTCSSFASPLMRYPTKKEGPFSGRFWGPSHWNGTENVARKRSLFLNPIAVICQNLSS